MAGKLCSSAGCYRCGQRPRDRLFLRVINHDGDKSLLVRFVDAARYRSDAGPFSFSPLTQKGAFMPAVKEKTSRPKSSPPGALVGKLSFGAITKKKEGARTVYPVLPDPNGQLALMAARIIERTAQIEALEGACTPDKSELKTLATPFYFTQSIRKIQVAVRVSVRSLV